MGWTETPLAPFQTVRDLIVEAYQGDPRSCGVCGWQERHHPRVTGSECDALYGPAKDRPDPHEFVPFVPRYRVLDYARSGGVAYLAVETIGTGEVWAGVCLVRQRKGALVYKEMDERMGPTEQDCPARILALLTPTDHPAALAWRARCRERLSRPKPTWPAWATPAS